jgi:hypothetical protein
MDQITRRNFLASLAEALAAGRGPVSAAIQSQGSGETLRLYLHREAGGLLSFGKPHLDLSDMPVWTWRRYLANGYMGDYEAQELDADALKYAREEFSAWTGVDAKDIDEQEFTRWLEEPLPEDKADNLTEAWMNKDGPAGQAAQFIEMLGIVTPEGYDDGIYIDDIPLLGAVIVSEQGLQRLKDAIATHGLPIEIIETQ